MRKLTLVLLLIAAVYACTEMQSEVPGSSDMKFCDSVANGGLCSYLPIDVDTSFSVGYDSDLDSAKQRLFDIFSWQTFVALNWPADNNGNPIGNSIGDYDTLMRVWEYYRDPADIFGNEPQLVIHLSAAKQQSHKFFYMDSKSPSALHQGDSTEFKEADGHPLIDRNLNFAVYEIRVNHVEDTFITNHNLTTIKGIDSFYNSSGEISLPESDSASRNPGAMEIKAAWRILDVSKGDDPSRYYTRNAIIYVDSSSSMNNKPLMINAKVGLVGMHIIRNTKKFYQNQIWTTFEHIDNTPDDIQGAQMDTSKKWSFYNPLCLNCPLNDTPILAKTDNGVYRWAATPPYAKHYAVGAPSQSFGKIFGTQAVRQYPVYKYTEQINKIWQAKLKGTVWANYRLIGTQWQQAESHPPPNAPHFLANTTLETYIQKDASCISCHGFAGVKLPNGNYIRTDFSFLFYFNARK